MKRVLLFSLMSLLMICCMKPPKKLIIGEWRLTNIEENNKQLNVPSDDDDKFIFEFNKNGSVILKIGSVSSDGVYQIENKIITMTIDEETTSMPINKINKKELVLIWEIDGRSLKMYFKKQ